MMTARDDANRTPSPERSFSQGDFIPVMTPARKRLVLTLSHPETVVSYAGQRYPLAVTKRTLLISTRTATSMSHPKIERRRQKRWLRSLNSPSPKKPAKPTNLPNTARLVSASHPQSGRTGRDPPDHHRNAWLPSIHSVTTTSAVIFSVRDKSRSLPERSS